jgi:hypothetical protein
LALSVTSLRWFVKGRSANPGGRPKDLPIPPGYAPDPTVADRRPISNLVVEARKYSALAVDTLVELTKDNYAASTRFSAATALLDRGYGRPAQSLDLHLSANAITKRLSDMTDSELAALEARMIAAAPIVLEATADVSGDAGELQDGDVEDPPRCAPSSTMAGPASPPTTYAASIAAIYFEPTRGRSLSKNSRRCA